MCKFAPCHNWNQAIFTTLKKASLFLPNSITSKEAIAARVDADTALMATIKRPTELEKNRQCP